MSIDLGSVYYQVCTPPSHRATALVSSAIFSSIIATTLSEDVYAPVAMSSVRSATSRRTSFSSDLFSEAAAVTGCLGRSGTARARAQPRRGILLPLGGGGGGGPPLPWTPPEPRAPPRALPPPPQPPRREPSVPTRSRTTRTGRLAEILRGDPLEAARLARSCSSADGDLRP